MVVDREGGFKSTSAVVAAAKYVTQATQMGTPWISWNEMTERLEYLYIRKVRIDIMRKYWALHSSMSSSHTAPLGNVAAQPSKQAEATAAEPTVQNKPRAASAAKRDNDEPPSNESQPQPKRGKKRWPPPSGAKPKPKAKTSRAKSSLDLTLEEGKRLKQSYEQVSAKASMILKAVESQSDWSWASGSPDVDALASQVKTLHEALTPFSSSFLTSEAKYVRDSHDDATLESSIKQMVKDLSTFIDDVRSQCQVMTQMQQGRVRALRGTPKRK